MFENSQIDTTGLPAAADVEWQGLDPSYRRQRVVVAALSLAGLAALLAALRAATTVIGIDAIPATLALLALVLLSPLALGWPFVSVPRMAYAVRERDVLFRSGVFRHTVTAIPYNRVQHVETDTSPLDRRYGLANLQIFTAGGAGGDLKISGLPADVAEGLRVFILQRIGASVERR